MSIESKTWLNIQWYDESAYLHHHPDKKLVENLFSAYKTPSKAIQTRPNELKVLSCEKKSLHLPTNE